MCNAKKKASERGKIENVNERDRFLIKSRDTPFSLILTQWKKKSKNIVT
jgi:hypothetical protein